MGWQRVGHSSAQAVVARGAFLCNDDRRVSGMAEGVIKI